MPRATAAKTEPPPTTDNPASPPSDDTSTGDWFVPLAEVTEFVNILEYGKEGAGKTSSLARMANVAPEGSKVLFINAEGGLKVRALRNRGVDVSKIVVFPNPTKQERLSHRALDKIYRRVKRDLTENPNSWFGVVFDSATDVHTALLDEAQERRIARLRERGATPDEYFVDIADYGTMTKMFRDLLRKFRDLPCHFGVTALERRTVDEDTKRSYYGPAVTPGLATDLLGYVDFVLCMKAEDEKGPYRALCRPTDKYRAKDRFDVLPKVLAEPTFDRVLSYLSEELTPETDPFQDRLQTQVAQPDDEQEQEDPQDGEEVA